MMRKLNGFQWALMTLLSVSLFAGLNVNSAAGAVSQSVDIAETVADSFQYPLKGGWNVTLGFGQFGYGDFAGKKHLGEDVMRTVTDQISDNAAVYAVANGVVKHNKVRTKYGNVVIIEHTLPDGSKVCSVYGHLRSVGVIAVGTKVEKGQLIGYLGTTAQNGGFSPHIHFGMRKGAYTDTWVYAGYDTGGQIGNWYNPSVFVQSHESFFPNPEEPPTPKPTAPIVPTTRPTTDGRCGAVETLEASPSESTTVGETVSIKVRATAGDCFRAMRILLDGNVMREEATTEFTYTWNTSGTDAGAHTLRVEVAKQGDNSWSNPLSEEMTYHLIASEDKEDEPTAETWCRISNFNVEPSSPKTVGASINISARAECSPGVRAIRIKVNNRQINEIGSTAISANWNTSGLTPGTYTIVVEASPVGDNNWQKSETQTRQFDLQAPVSNPTNVPNPTSRPNSTSVPNPTSAPQSTEAPACSAPAIENFNTQPASPVDLGAYVRVVAKAAWNDCFRAMRILLDGQVIHEEATPEYAYNWNTGNLSAGNHTLRLEVAALGDNNWSRPSVKEMAFTVRQAVSCEVTGLSVSPSSPQTVGTRLNINASGSCNTGVRAIRIKVDGSIIQELGAPSLPYTWDTSGAGAGTHTITAEVAGQNDNDWIKAASKSIQFTLNSVPVPTAPPAAPSLSKPQPSSPGNGTIQSGSNVTLAWNGVSGAAQYLVEIWGGNFGGTHQQPCGWQSATSCPVSGLQKYNYLWRVQARDAAGNTSPWSDEWNFTIP